jgi:hypothetical protein
MAQCDRWRVRESECGREHGLRRVPQDSSDNGIFPPLSTNVNNKEKVNQMYQINIWKQI